MILCGKKGETGETEEEEDLIELTPKIRADYDIPPPKFLPLVNQD